MEAGRRWLGEGAHPYGPTTMRGLRGVFPADLDVGRVVTISHFGTFGAFRHEPVNSIVASDVCWILHKPATTVATAKLPERQGTNRGTQLAESGPCAVSEPS
jgi:hypothetical protein